MSSHETRTVETTETTDRPGVRYGQIARVVLLAIPVILVAALAAANTRKVTIDWIVGDAETNLWIVIALAAAIGFMAGYLARWRRS